VRLLRSSFPDRRAREAALAKALALLHEAAAHASARLAAAAALAAGADADAAAGGSAARPPQPPLPPRCALLVSDRGGAEGEGPPLLFVYQRWLPLIFALRACLDAGGNAGGGAYALALLPTDAGPRDASGAA
jgi:hypothetical protein